MNFTNIYQYDKSFSSTIKGQRDGAYDIEQASIINDFVNDDVKYCSTTDMKLKDWDNVLMNKYYDKIKASCETRTLSAQEQAKYNRNPELMSSEIYGTPSLWYLLLYINNCESMEDFVDLPYVLVPSISTIRSCLVDEEYILNKESL